MKQIHDIDETDHEIIDLGPCCACGREGPEVRNLITINHPAPVPGSGWGCAICHLPFDGAMVVICDACLGSKAEYKFAIYGLAAEKGRILFDQLPTDPFDHDQAAHRRFERQYGIDLPHRRNGHNQRSKRTRRTQ